MKIGIFLDEDIDRKNIIKEIKDMFKKYKPSYVDDVCISSKLIDNDGFDLVIIDYGGLTSIPGNSLGECYARDVNKYAEEHPNTLFIYITVMGEEYLRAEGLNLDELHNIKWCNREDLLKTWKEYNKD
jgi:hypothetical protein